MADLSSEVIASCDREQRIMLLGISLCPSTQCPLVLYLCGEMRGPWSAAEADTAAAAEGERGGQEQGLTDAETQVRADDYYSALTFLSAIFSKVYLFLWVVPRPPTQILFYRCKSFCTGAGYGAVFSPINVAQVGPSQNDVYSHYSAYVISSCITVLFHRAVVQYSPLGSSLL